MGTRMGGRRRELGMQRGDEAPGHETKAISDEAVAEAHLDVGQSEDESCSSELGTFSMPRKVASAGVLWSSE
jgi:hypothetical protein